MLNSSIIKASGMFAILCLSTTHVFAKSCYFNNLSNQYSFQIITEESNQIPNHPITSVEVVISRKKDNQIVQALSFIQANSHLPHYECSSRSFITHYQLNKKVIDGNYGDMVVGDFNFSGKEGLAIASETTNGEGQLYKFYFQNKHGRWVDKTNFISPDRDYFSRPFPTIINPKMKTLAFAARTGATHTVNTTYQHDEKSGKWHTIDTKMKPATSLQTKTQTKAQAKIKQKNNLKHKVTNKVNLKTPKKSKHQ